MNSRYGLLGVCLLGWASTLNYTNHAALMPVLIGELEFGPTQAGLLSTGFFVALALACVAAGVWTDRAGPKRVGTLGLALTFLSNLALGLARNFPDLLLIKLVGGLGAGMAFVAGVRYATLAFSPAAVHRVQGLYGGCVQLGGGTAVYLMPLLYSLLGWRLAFVASSGFVAVALAVWMASAADLRARLPASRLSVATRSGEVWVLGLVHGATFGLAVLVGTWVTTYLVHDLGLSLVSAGAAGSAILAMGILARPFGGILIDGRLLAPRQAMQASLVVGAVGLALLAYPGRPVGVAVLGIVAAGLALSLPYAAVMNSASASLPEAPGAAVGMVSSIALVLLAAGAPAVGALYALTGRFSLAFWAMVAFSLLVLLLISSRQSYTVSK